MLILSIESSCDETAATIVKDGREVLSSIVATQIAEHKIYGGVVPEIARRRHTESISAVVNEAIESAGITYKDIDAVAVTFAPGLIGALLVGVNFAKGLAMRLGVPLIPVHHLRSHIAANYIAYPELEPPFLCLLASGGNSLIAEVKGYTDFNIIGKTRDDAAGECFDKVARTLGMSYPGGVNLDKVADPEKADMYKLPTPSVEGHKYDFSYTDCKNRNKIRKDQNRHSGNSQHKRPVHSIFLIRFTDNGHRHDGTVSGNTGNCRQRSSQTNQQAIRPRQGTGISATLMQINGNQCDRTIQ